MSKYLQQKNILNIQLKQLYKCVENNNVTISRMKQQIMSDYLLIQIKKMISQNETHEQDIISLQERLSSIKDGKRDDIIYEKNNTENDELDKKIKQTFKKKSEDKIKKEELSVISKEYYISSRKNDRQNKYMKKSMGRSFKYYNRVIHSLPDYMKQNLDSMSNNKGYKFRDVIFYGKLPYEYDKPSVVFEKKGGILIIHEWKDGKYRVYHKKRNEYKKLCSTENYKTKFEAPLHFFKDQSELIEKVKKQKNKRKPYTNRRDDKSKPYTNRRDDKSKPYTNRRDDKSKPYTNRRDDKSKPYTNRRDDNNTRNNSSYKKRKQQSIYAEKTDKKPQIPQKSALPKSSSWGKKIE
jgi:hypothetical protein